ncbi:hypothetical protein HYPSUDRAFT_33483 [Hypholoma sublateritium FD-334 SS-4]|uniref:Uncharacterized protein n=1 Tax=Hypholoma sublateritium (strain FD-334 SS-4) TaxID=945553 RepID=A0A0D2LLZ5_HYPSF|nr:hypothetical protein HYPSUDRAFT_33483 [Hypholoma sublateritium FD-334 SS-4]
MLNNYSKKVLLAVALVSTVSAQNSVFDSLSSSCTTALKELLLAPDAQCLNTAAFISIAISGNVDVPAIANTWLSGLCSVGTCSNASLASIVNNVTAGCSQDVQNFFNIDVSDPATYLPFVEQYYPTLRQIACLKDDGANTLCVPQTITNLQSIIGNLSVADLSWDTIVADANEIASSDNQNLACTSCTKQAYTLAANVFPDPNLLATIDGPITATCGASFIDGQNVTTVAQTAVVGEFNVNTTTSASASFSPITIAGAMLFTISSMFTLLI